MNGSGQIYWFNEYRLDTESRTLWRGDELVPLTPKALDLLILLVENAGAVVSREDLLDGVWDRTFVDESNITYTVSLLRRAFGDADLIRTVPKRGYRFVAGLRREPDQKPSIAQGSAPQRRTILIAVAVICVLFLTSFALFWRTSVRTRDVPVNASDAMQAYTRGRMILD